MSSADTLLHTYKLMLLQSTTLNKHTVLNDIYLALRVKKLVATVIPDALIFATLVLNISYLLDNMEVFEKCTDC